MAKHTMDKEGQELDEIQDNRGQPSQVIDADIILLAGLLELKDGAKEGVLNIMQKLLKGWFVNS